MLPIIVGVAAALTATSIAIESDERSRLFRMARQYANQVDKPLLVIGLPKGDYPCGNVTGDIDPHINVQCPVGGEIIDVRSIPYPDGYFGASFVSHVLEHLPSPDDVRIAWNELWRVSDMVYVAWPRQSNLWAIITPAHHLWIQWNLEHPEIIHVHDRYR